MGICRFEIKNILLLEFRSTVLWSFQQFACVSTKDDSLNEPNLVKELEVTATYIIHTDPCYLNKYMEMEFIFWSTKPYRLLKIENGNGRVKTR